IAADVLTLAVPKKQKALRQKIADELAQLPAGRTADDIAADLATLGISQGQLGFWDGLQREVVALGKTAPKSGDPGPQAK
ncbi:MAG TPA: hypothetical protein VGR07_24000, partial [Thermoanaerobaculia bacterium]|nr:hypothetical protein [Thermoanaerobaculia bacterium]